MSKITYVNEAYDQEISIKMSDDADVNDFIDTMKTLFIAIGYHPKNWPLEEE